MKAKKYYLAILFEEHPNLHMTVRYYGRTEPWLLGHRISCISRISNTFEKFTMDFDPLSEITLEDADTHAPLVCWRPNSQMPEWVQHLSQSIWLPHVTAETVPRTLNATSIAIMSSKQIICEWELK